jgi:hypothetical protein
MRRAWLMGALFLAACAPVGAQEDLNVLPEKIDNVAPAGLVSAALMQEAHAALDRRDAAYEALKSKEEIGAYLGQRLRFFRQQLGAFPERSPLNAKTASRTERDGYVLEKVIFESQPGFHVTGLLYLPATPGPFPAVLHPCGHSENGKAAEAYQRASILLAKNGLAVLCYDPVGQGERKQILGPDGSAPYRATATWRGQWSGMGCGRSTTCSPGRRSTGSGSAAWATRVGARRPLT